MTIKRANGFNSDWLRVGCQLRLQQSWLLWNPWLLWRYSPHQSPGLSFSQNLQASVNEEMVKKAAAQIQTFNTLLQSMECITTCYSDAVNKEMQCIAVSYMYVYIRVNLIYKIHAINLCIRLYIQDNIHASPVNEETPKMSTCVVSSMLLSIGLQ